MNTEQSPSTNGPGSKEFEDLLNRRLGSRVRELRLVIQQAGVILQGWSETYHAKQVAQHAVMELCPVPILANEIKVK